MQIVQLGFIIFIHLTLPGYTYTLKPITINQEIIRNNQYHLEKKTMDKIIIQDLRVLGIIGVYDEERHTPQEIRINLCLFTFLEKAGASDRVTDSVDYAQITMQVQNLAETAQRFTIEALATDIARLCLETPGIEKVIVRVEKPGAISSAGSVGVEIERERGSYTR